MRQRTKAPQILRASRLRASVVQAALCIGLGVFCQTLRAAAITPADGTWPPPPFSAWVGVASAYVSAQPNDSIKVGLVRYGDVLQVTGCLPSCEDAGAWAVLGTAGSIRLSLLRPPPVPLGAASVSSIAHFQYGRVRQGGALGFAQPDTASRVEAVFNEEQELAFRPAGPASSAGWLQRPDGTYVQRSRIQPLLPSAFFGEPTAGALAFVTRATRMLKDDGPRVPVARYRRFALLLDATAPPGMVRVAGGLLPRGAVRLILPRARPNRVPADARWVYVDRSQQTLTAYEGDQMVFATLVSTGKPETPTPAGLYRVFFKVIHDTMHGEADDPYLVEEVPFAMYFLRGMSLHGTFWHDSFGSRASHGCVNLSIRDAQRLFDWAPPALPAGWHAAFPVAGGQPTLWVLVG